MTSTSKYSVPLVVVLLSLGVASAFQQPTILQHRTQQQQTSSSALCMAMRRGRGPPPVKEKKPPMNDEINFPELRVVTPNPKGKDDPLGIMSLADAKAKAQEMGGLDLILVNGKSDPPVCKIVDYSKYRYQQEKKAKDLKKKSKATEVKEVKMSYKIDVHDYEVRRKNALKFLNQGNRVKCTVMFRGREMQHDRLGFELLDKLAIDLEDTCAKEGRPKKEGRNLSLILSPRTEVLKAINEKRKADEKSKKKKRKESFDEKQAAKAVVAATAVTEVAANGDAVAVNGDAGKGDLDVEASLDELLEDDYIDDLFN